MSVHKKPAASKRQPLDKIPELCRQGKLFDVQRWIEAEKPLNFTVRRSERSRESTPLAVALEMGFHSLAEVLLRAGAEVHAAGHNCPMLIALEKNRVLNATASRAWLRSLSPGLV